MRIARLCPQCKMRVFDDPDWLCPEHGIAEVQENRPSRGDKPSTSTKEARVQMLRDLGLEDYEHTFRQMSANHERQRGQRRKEVPGGGLS